MEGTGRFNFAVTETQEHGMHGNPRVTAGRVWCRDVRSALPLAVAETSYSVCKPQRCYLRCPGGSLLLSGYSPISAPSSGSSSESSTLSLGRRVPWRFPLFPASTAITKVSLLQDLGVLEQLGGGAGAGISKEVYNCAKNRFSWGIQIILWML